MTTPILSFITTSDGVAKTALVYHLCWMFAERGLRVLAVDLDPQANLTASFLDEGTLDHLWNGGGAIATLFDGVRPLLAGGELAPVAFREISTRLALIPGHPGLAALDQPLSAASNNPREGRDPARPPEILTAFWRSAQDAAHRFGADLIVFDLGPNLGAINRAALTGSDYVVVPLGADLISLQSLRNLGPTLRDWHTHWRSRRASWVEPRVDLPDGDMKPVGYVAMRQGVQLTRPVQAYTRWLDQIPAEYRRCVLGTSEKPGTDGPVPGMADDPHCLGMLKNYQSLMPLSQESGKPIFALRPADGAIGAHAYAVREAYIDFDALARKIAMRMNPAWAERVA